MSQVYYCERRWPNVRFRSEADIRLISFDVRQVPTAELSPSRLEGSRWAASEVLFPLGL